MMVGGSVVDHMIRAEGSLRGGSSFGYLRRMLLSHIPFIPFYHVSF